MNAKKLIYTGLCLLFFSCGNNGSSTDDEVKVPIQFSGEISTYTRATNTGFESNDQIGVYITQWNGSTQRALAASGNYADNQLYTYSASGFSSSSPLYYPSDESKINVYAYYPRTTTTSATNISFAVKANQSATGEYTKSDLMTSSASGRSSSSSPIPLVFTHALSKVVINLDEATVPAGTATIKISNVYSGCTYNLADGSCTPSGSKSEIILAPNGKNSFTAILPPQAFAANQLLATVTINGTSYTWNPTYQIDFTKNIENSYTLYFENREVVAFTATINPWEKPKINEVVPPDMQAKIKQHMPIYNGTTPPNVEGTYLVNPLLMTHSSITGDEVSNFADDLFRFSNQSIVNNTLDYDSKQGTATESGKGYFISGSGTNFTVFFNTIGTSSGISTKQAVVISGTKTAQGISNYYYAFLLLEKGNDPDGKLVPVGTYRIFKDGNNLASNATWTGTRSINSATGHSMYDMWKK